MANIQPVYDDYGNIISWEEYRDPGLLPDGTYQRPLNPDYGKPGGYDDPYLPEPPQSGFDQTSGTWHPEPSTLGKPGEPTPTPTPTPTVQPPPGPGAGPGPSANPYASSPEFHWPTLTAPPPFAFDAYQAPTPFSYDPFSAPTLAQAEQEPGYAFGKQEGLQALGNALSRTGTFRSGATPKAFYKWADANAQQNYGNVYNRAANTYTMNRGNAFDTWGTNERARAESYDRNRTTAQNVYSTNWGVQKDVFAPQQRTAELTFDDLFRRYKDRKSVV